MAKLRLTLDLIPKSTFNNNVRAIVSKKQWDYIRSQVYSEAYNICEICGGIGPKHPVEAHEIFSYNDKTLVQKLEKIIALCPNCHMCKHMGLAEIMGKKIIAKQHLMHVNKMTKKQANIYIAECFKIWKERSNKNWILDLTHLKKYGIDIINFK